jgi:uncharacterized protein (DUF697 family)
MAVEVSSETEEVDLVDRLATYLSNAIDKTDEAAAFERVSALQQANPEAGTDALVAMLIRKKCLLTAGMGALSPVTALIGIPLNLGLIFKWQAELVLEVAAVNQRTLDDREKRNIVLIVTGLSVGTTQVTRLISKGIERIVARYVAKSKAAKASTPLIGSVISASVNVIFTYLIGKRAHDYFRQNP